VSARRLAAALPLLAGAAALLVLFLLTDARPARDWRLRTVYIPRGSSASRVARLMEEGGVLEHPLVFRLLVAATMSGRHLQYGEYTFPTPPSALDVWRKLASGDVTRFAVTIPEGATLFDVAAILASFGLVSPDDFLAAASSRTLLASLRLPGPTAEGFLFPDTYQFVKYMTPEEIIGIMVARFRRAFTPDLEKAAHEAGLSVGEAVTIASIIEKETAVPAEKPLVSAVIRRRLALGMPLQMDPTVIYGLRAFDRELTRKDLQTPTPYNTYVHRGLPPGPIANPGIDSLRAAVFPARTNYLYFVSRNDGSHTFSETIEGHARAVASYREKRTRGRRGAGEAKSTAPGPPRSAPAPAAPEPTPPPPPRGSSAVPPRAPRARTARRARTSPGSPRSTARRASP